MAVAQLWIVRRQQHIMRMKTTTTILTVFISIGLAAVLPQIGKAQQPPAKKDSGNATAESNQPPPNITTNGLRVVSNPDQVRVKITSRKPDDVRIYEAEFAGYFTQNATKIKQYKELKTSIAIVAQLTLQQSNGVVKPPHLQGIPKVSEEFSGSLKNGQYSYIAWNHDCGDLFLGADGSIYTGGKGTLTFLWFVPSDTTTIELVFPDQKPVTVALQPQQ